MIPRSCIFRACHVNLHDETVDNDNDMLSTAVTNVMTLQDRMYCSQIRDVDQLKSRLIEEWAHFHQVVIDKAVRQWRPRLGACV